MPQGETTAAYCGMSETVFEYEARDLFEGELFCPSCGSRTAPEDRGASIDDIQSRFPAAHLYEPPKPLAHTRPHAR